MPILLLDDCFSELDDNRQAGLERLCEGTQAFFTTTHQEHFARFSGEVQKVEV
jgi:recombinational DNA repair ATPase RecF